MNKYLKANRYNSRTIGELLSGWDKIVRNSGKLAVKHGASRVVYTTKSFATLRVSGFIFKDESKVDKKIFVRLKGTDDGWRPRRNSSELSKIFESFRSGAMSEIMDLLGMKLFSGGLTYTTPGVVMRGAIAYLTVPVDLKVKPGFTRISDIEYEKAIGGVK